MPEKTLGNKWKKYEESCKRKIDFQTCDEEEIQNFGEWLADYENRMRKKTWDEKSDEVYSGLMACCRRFEKNGWEPEQIQRALEKSLNTYMENTVYGIL